MSNIVKRYMVLLDLIESIQDSKHKLVELGGSMDEVETLSDCTRLALNHVNNLGIQIENHIFSQGDQNEGF